MKRWVAVLSIILVIVIVWGIKYSYGELSMSTSTEVITPIIPTLEPTATSTNTPTPEPITIE